MMFGRLKIAAIAVGSFVIAVFAAYLRGRSDKAAADEHEELEEYVETRQRMDESDAELGNDPAAADRFLHERKRNRDL
jgi:hypothetical protein